MNRLITAAILGTALALPAHLVSPAAAQVPQPVPQQTAPRGVPQPVPAAPAGDFTEQVMISDTFEITSSRLALEKSRSNAVRRYARAMVRDHGKTTAELMRIEGTATVPTPQGRAQRPGEVPPHGMLDARREAMVDELRGLSGSAFDRAYLRMQVAAHQEAVALFATYAQSGEDADLRQFASRNLPALRTHLRDAQRLESQINRSPNRALNN
jgi:putative membrane protein